jgi:hypothetical protein
VLNSACTRRPVHEFFGAGAPGDGIFWYVLMLAPPLL